MRKHKLALLLAIVLMTAGLTGLAQAGWIHAKAVVAQVLLEDAWQDSLNSGKTRRPWQWADTWPVARLVVPGKQHSMVVLHGGNGAALPFAPGYIADSAMPGDKGISVLVAHRDTHFAFLGSLVMNDRLTVTRMDGYEVPYRVRSMRIIDTREDSQVIRSDKSQLVMVTCYPFNAIEAGTPYRYVVTAEAVTTPVLTRM